jgi:hypothetical protein
MRLSTPTLAALAGAAALAAASPLRAQDAAASKLSLHGYLTQGAGMSDSSQVIGIGKDGTTNYRRAALLMRYTQTPKDAFVVQVAHRSLGDSPIMAFEPDVKVDWAFYERRFLENSSIRVGKAPIPFGIYNETRYTGTLLPFYRAPYAMYFEGAYTSETVDGLVLSTALLADSPFRVDASVYGGNYGLLEFSQRRSPTTGAYEYLLGKAKAENAIGGQLWVSTPIDGFRLGGGASRATMDGGVLRLAGPKETKREWHVGVDANFDRFAARSENVNIVYPNLSYRGYYGQGGVRVLGGLTLNGQGEVGRVMIRNLPGPVSAFDIPLIRDYAAGANYAFRSDLVLKVEGHRTNGFNVEQGTNIYSAQPTVGRYYITSLSLAF